jgi:hypothetical protein
MWQSTMDSRRSEMRAIVIVDKTNYQKVLVDGGYYTQAQLG